MGQFIDRLTEIPDLATLTPAADKFLFVSAYSAGVSTWSFATVTSFARTILDDADAATMRATLGATAVGHVHAIGDVTGLQSALDLKAPLASPAFTGNPTAPTQTAGNSTTRLASTEFVSTAIGNLIGAAPALLDTLSEISDALGDDPNFAATMTTALAGKLAIASNLSDVANASTARSNLGLVPIASTGSAADLSTGTIPDGRFPATLPAINGSALTNLNGANITSGVITRTLKTGADATAGTAYIGHADAGVVVFSDTELGGEGAARKIVVKNLSNGGYPFVVTGDGSLTALTLNGNGANITSINAANIGSGTLAVARGGTGLATYAIGDLVYASGATTLSKLAAVAAGSVLVSGGVTTAPAWSANLSISGYVAAPNGEFLDTVRTANGDLVALMGIANTGGQALTPILTNQARTISRYEGVIHADCSSAGFTLTLPSTPVDGEIHTFVKSDTTTNTLTLTPWINAAGATGDLTLSTSREFATIQWVESGPYWRILSRGQTIAPGGGGATSPGGATTQVQFNDAGAFNGDAGFTYNKTTDTATITNISGTLVNYTTVTAGTLNAGDATNPIVIQAFGGGHASWLNIPAVAGKAAGIGSGGPGVNVWLGYAGSAGHFFSNSAAGDIVFRNARILFGNTADATAALTLANDDLNLRDNADLVLGTSSGSMVGTGTTQKLAFFGSTPIVQPANTTDIRTALINLGLLATGGASPLDLNGGALRAGRSSINTATVTARLNVYETTIGGEVVRIESDSASGDDPAEVMYQNRIATTDATVTTIQTIAIPASTAVGIEVIITARRTGGSAGAAGDSAYYQRYACYRNEAGTVAIVGAAATPVTMESQAGWDVTFSISTTNVLVRVTGAANNTVTWHAHIRTWRVST